MSTLFNMPKNEPMIAKYVRDGIGLKHGMEDYHVALEFNLSSIELDDEKNTLPQPIDLDTAGQWVRVITRYIRMLDDTQQIPDNEKQGSTLNWGIVTKRFSYSANIGDSLHGVLVYDDGKRCWAYKGVNTLHNQNNKAERTRLENSGKIRHLARDGYLYQYFDPISNSPCGLGRGMTRSVGDTSFRQAGLINEAQYTSQVNQSQPVFIFASDFLDYPRGPKKNKEALLSDMIQKVANQYLLSFIPTSDQIKQFTQALGQAVTQAWTRVKNKVDDATIIVTCPPDNMLQCVAVCDGHGGAAVSAFVAATIEKTVHAMLTQQLSIQVLEERINQGYRNYESQKTHGHVAPSPSMLFLQPYRKKREDNNDQKSEANGMTTIVKTLRYENFLAEGLHGMFMLICTRENNQAHVVEQLAIFFSALTQRVDKNEQRDFFKDDNKLDDSLGKLFRQVPNNPKECLAVLLTCKALVKCSPKNILEQVWIHGDIKMIHFILSNTKQGDVLLAAKPSFIYNTSAYTLWERYTRNVSVNDASTSKTKLVKTKRLLSDCKEAHSWYEVISRIYKQLTSNSSNPSLFKPDSTKTQAAQNAVEEIKLVYKQLQPSWQPPRAYSREVKALKLLYTQLKQLGYTDPMVERQSNQLESRVALN